MIEPILGDAGHFVPVLDDETIGVAAAAALRRRSQIPGVAVRRLFGFDVAGRAVGQRLRMSHVTVVVHGAAVAVDHVRQRIAGDVHTALAHVDGVGHIGHVERLARILIDRIRVVAGHAVLDRLPRSAVQGEREVAVGAVLVGCDVLGSGTDAAVGHEVIDRVIRRQRHLTRTVETDLEAHAVGQARLPKHLDRIGHGRDVRRKGVTIVAVTQLFERTGIIRRRLNRLIEEVRRIRVEPFRTGSLYAIHVALPVRDTAVHVGIGGGHELGKREPHDAFRDAECRLAVFGGHRELDHRRARDGHTGDFRLQLTESLDLFGGELTAITNRN